MKWARGTLEAAAVDALKVGDLGGRTLGTATNKYFIVPLPFSLYTTLLPEILRVASLTDSVCRIPSFSALSV